ncbi:unnamed protein product [Paramecium sonneborni]|uniref:Uncharacterized protein n=1 Tax=Paramecium sonneborni TaxID=65129 RepID=A0A8S1MBI5_9CILI|nr:unnamed protein product [Paramecium sonneborni]
MNQQFSVEYLRINPYRYRRLPSLNATGSQIFNLSQEMITSRTKKNLVKPKLQALSHKKEDSKNFYHHSTIYNVREFKELSKVQDYQENNLTKYNELQTKIMVADFKKKVDAFLSKNNYKTNMVGSKITSSLHELESFQSTNNEEQLNKSLCSNKYTIRTEYKSLKATEILVISNNKVVSRQIISSELIQQRLLKQMEHFLKDDRYNYDLKMKTMIDQYEDIVKRIKQQAYTVKIPQSYQIQMSDYNEFYYKQEEQQIPSFNVKLDLLADQIIQEIQQSRESTPQMQSQINEVQQEEISPYIDIVVKTEPICIKEEESPNQVDWTNDQVRERKISQRKVKPRKKQQQQQQQQNEQILDINNPKSQQSSQSELSDVSYTQQFHPKKEIREKKNSQQNTQPIQQIHIDIVPDHHQQVEVIQNQHYLQNTNKKHLNIDKHKTKVHSRKVTGDTVQQRQTHIHLEIPKEQILDTLSERSHDETQQLEEIQPKIQEQIKQELEIQQTEKQEIEQQVIEVQNVQEIEKQELDSIQNQQFIKPVSINKQLHNSEQRDAVEIWEDTKSTVIKINPKIKPALQENKKNEQLQKEDNHSNQQFIENNNLISRKSSENQEQQQIQQEIVNQNTLQLNPPLNIIEPKEIKQESQTKQLQQENKTTIKNQVESQIQTNSIKIKEGNVTQKIKEEDFNKIDYEQIINEKMKLIEQKLQQPCLDIIDILLASDIVYNVSIDKYKISKSYKKKVNHPTFMFQQKDEEEVFVHQVIWKHEVQEVIPKMQNLNKHLEVIIDENDDLGRNSLQNIEQLNEESDN